MGKCKYIDGSDIVWLDRNRHDGGLLFYLNYVYSHSTLFTGTLTIPGFSSTLLDNLITVLCIIV